MNAGLRRLLSFLSFAVGFAAAAVVLSAVVPPLRVSHISVKLDWLASHPTEHDSIVIGSSRMRQIVPSILDAELAARGIQTRAFNLSADGMRPPEDSYVLDRMLNARKAPLKFIFMEANPVALRISDEDEGTSRMIHWHDTTRLAMIWRRAFAHSIVEPPWIGKWLSDTWRQVRFAIRHTGYWIWNSVRLGRGQELVERTLEIPIGRKWEIGLGALNDGYIPPNESVPMSAADVKGYQRALNKKLREGSQLDVMDSASQTQIQRAAMLAKEAGARLVVVAAPSVQVKTFQPILPPDTGAVFIDLSDPVKYPSLFDLKVRRDGSHLTAEGSILFTRILAEHLAAVVANEKESRAVERGNP